MMDGQPILIAPSILSADFMALGEAVTLVEDAGADWIHVDVMDGHFVPNLTIGPPVVRSLKRVATVPLDVHLMITNADTSVEWYLDAGADMITVHAEASDDLSGTIARIRAAGAKPGVSVNPETPTSALADVIGLVDHVLVMSVHPGFSGQSFIADAIPKVAQVAHMLREVSSGAVIEVDGGIDVDTAPVVVAEGARALVAGSAIFARPDPSAALSAIRSAAEGAVA